MRLCDKAKDYAVAAFIVGTSFDWLWWIRTRAQRACDFDWAYWLARKLERRRS